MRGPADEGAGDRAFVFIPHPHVSPRTLFRHVALRQDRRSGGSNLRILTRVSDRAHDRSEGIEARSRALQPDDDRLSCSERSWPPLTPKRRFAQRRKRQTKTLITNATAFRIPNPSASSYSSNGIRIPVPTNVRYSAHRFANHNPMHSVSSRAPYATTAAPMASR